MSLTSGKQLLLSAAAGGGAAGYQISRSLRFNSSDSGFCARTYSSAGSRTTWTWSAWVKRSALGSQQTLFDGYSDGSNRTQLMFESDDKLRILNQAGGSVTTNLITTAVFRDVSAWYHIVIVWDTTQGTSSNRAKVYVNGTQQTSFSTATYPGPSENSFINAANAHDIGRTGAYTEAYLSAYLADIFFIDGSAKVPGDFAETDATTGAWNPKAYSGSYGTNGFHLDFADNSNNTASTLGKDTSGNGHNWTPNNLSVTAGAGNDSLVDSPSNGTASTGGDAGGVTVGNYATLNPLSSSNGTLSNGNLTHSGGSGNGRERPSTFAASSGKWYFEGTLTSWTNSGSDAAVGVTDITKIDLTKEPGQYATSYIIYNYTAFANIYKINNGSATATNTTRAVQGDIIGIAFDLDNNKFYAHKNGTWIDGLSPGGTALFNLTSGTYTPVSQISYGNSMTWDYNFGQRQFSYAAPAGFKSLCTANLPTPTIAKGSDYMDVKLYTGNGSTQTISGLNFSPDFVWIKDRSQANGHGLFDVIRGTTKGLFSNLTNGEITDSNSLTSFDSTGFSTGSGGTTFSTNINGNSYVAWAWDAGSSTASNTQGSITSQVRANASAGFSVVSYTAAYTGSARTVGHGLGVKPNLIILKNRNDGSANWRVYHSASGASLPLVLNSTAAASSNFGIWNNTEPTSSIFTIGINTDVGGNSGSGEGLIAYCFAPVAGYSSFGSYTGNGSSDGPFVYTGHRPRWILLKATSITNESWIIIDTARSTYNVVDAFLRADTSEAEFSSSLRYVDILSNGFKFRASGTEVNGNGTTYVYASFAESPFAYARAR